MRTTIAIDDDLAGQLTELARDSRESFRSVLNGALRRGLSDVVPLEQPFEVQAHAGELRPGVDGRRFNELVFELEEQNFATAAGGKRN